ncbi:MAG TPA: AI-2E family transporter [Candidatus Paceibacterota bacterium]|nr:AI-2E family transporter [Candidatus Paceibacterota bacterium]
MDKHRVENISLLVLFGGVSLLLFYVFAPFIQVLALAAVFATLLEHQYQRLTSWCGGSKSTAASLMVLILLIFFIAPLFFLGVEIFREAQTMYLTAQGSGVQYVQTFQSSIQTPLQRIIPGFTVDINSYVVNALGFISSNLAGLVYRTFFVVFETFLMLIAFFFFLRDGETFFGNLRQMSPLGTTVSADIIANMKLAVQSVIKGTLLTALIRWIFVGVGFYFVGIPNALLWGSIGGIVGAIPGVGTPIVFIPAIAYLFLEGHTALAIGLTIFTVITVMLLDNMLAPYYFSRGLAAPQIFVLFSILGGVLFFGPLGFIFGPLVLSVFLSLLHVYSGMNVHTTAVRPRASRSKVE